MKALLFAAGLISFVLYQSRKLDQNLYRNLKGPYKLNVKMFDDKKALQQNSIFKLNTSNILTTAYSPFTYANDTTN
jgi:hypothetical protein